MDTVGAVGRVTRLARRHGLVRSVLRRRSDRVEAAVTAVTAVLAVLVVAVAVLVAMGSSQRQLSQAAVTAGRETPVTAVLLTDAQLPDISPSEESAAMGTTAVARWPLPNGQQRSAPLWVGADRHAGDRVAIWIDQHGNRTDPPEPPGSMIADAVASGVVLVLSGWAVLGALWWTVCRVLNRVNATSWELQWARIEPGWSRRTWQ